MSPTAKVSRLLLICLGLLSLGVVYTNVGFPPVLVDVAREFDITIGTAGIAVGAFGLTGIPVVLIAGPFGDRYGRRRFLLAGATIVGLGAVGSSFAPTFELLFVGRALAGVGASLCFANILAVLAENVPYRERGRAVSVVVGIQTFAAVVGIPLSGFISASFDWRLVFFVMAGVSWSAALLALFVIPESPRSSLTSLPYHLYLRVLADRSALGVLAIGFLSGMAWATWASYFVAFLETSFGVSRTLASTLALSTGLGIFAGTQFGGRLGDRLGHRRMLGLMLVAGAVPLLAIGGAGAGLAATTALHAALALFSGARLATHTALISDQQPQARSTLMALYAASMSASLAVGAYLGGRIVDGYGFLALALACAALMLASAVILKMLVVTPVHRRATTGDVVPAQG